MSLAGLALAAGSSAESQAHGRATWQAQPGSLWGRHQHRRKASARACLLLQPGCSGFLRASLRRGNAQGGAKGRWGVARNKKNDSSSVATRASGAENAQTVSRGKSNSNDAAHLSQDDPGADPGTSPGSEFKTAATHSSSFPEEASPEHSPGQEPREGIRGGTRKHPLLQILPYLRPHWPLIARAWVCTGIATACLLLFVPRLGQLSEAMGRGDLQGLARKSCAVVALVALRSLCTFLQDAWLWECALEVVADLRQGTFEAVLAQDMGFLENSPGAGTGSARGAPTPRHSGEPAGAPRLGGVRAEAGAGEASPGKRSQETAPGSEARTGLDASLGSKAGVMAGAVPLGSEAGPGGQPQEAELGGESMALGDVLFRLTVETRECGDVVFALLKAAVPAALQAAAMTSRMVTLSPVLTVSTLCVLPAMAVVIAGMGEVVRGISARAQRSAAALSDYVSEVLPGMLAVKTQLREAFEARRFRALVASDVGTRLAKKRAKALFPEAITGAYTLAVTVLFGVSAWAVGRGRLTPGGIVAFFSSLVLLVEPIQAAGSAYNEVKQGQPALERVLELLHLPRAHSRRTSSEAQAGTHPVSKPGAHPTSKPGAHPTPEPGAHLTPEPRAHPTPEPGAHPTSEAHTQGLQPCTPTPPPTPLRGPIRLDHVSFRYRPSLAGRGSHEAVMTGPHRSRDLALADVAFEIQAGESVAIVGPSGSGKSTLLSLLLRLHSPTAGRITLAGRDIADVEDDTWRRTVGVVPQQTILFSGTVAANIAYGHLPLGAPDPTADAGTVHPILGFTSAGAASPGANRALADSQAAKCNGDAVAHRGRTNEEIMEQVVRAARLADAHGFIGQLPGGYQSQIGRDGCTLSGGQRQRVAIARALFHDPAILVLDEPTSSLDNLSRRAVRGALQKLMADRTVILVDHKLDAVEGVDRVIYLQEGQVVEDGPAAELLRKEGGYVNALFRQATSPD